MLATRAPAGNRRRVAGWAVLVAALASLPSLFVGFSSDDLSHRLMLEGRVPGYAGGWLGLYDFTPPSAPASLLIEQGLFPWFTNPELALRFFRPLSSLTLALDHALFGRNALLAHLHSVLWVMALAGVAGRLYQRWFGASAALMASIIFALSGTHAIPVSWLASRHSLVAATFGALSLWAWVRYREDQLGTGLALALSALVASLSSSESGLVTVVLLASYEVGTRGLRRGIRGAALPLAVGFAYLALYAALEYGTRGSSFYVSPFASPLDYLTRALSGVPGLAAELLVGVPSIAAGMGGRPAELLFAAIGASAVVGAFFLLRALAPLLGAGSGRVLAWLSLGSLVGLAALVGAPISGRVLPLPLLAASAVAGNAVWGAWGMARGTLRPLLGSEESHPGRGRAGGRQRWWAAFIVVALFQLVLSPMVRLGLPFELMKASQAQQRIAKDADVGTCTDGGSVYLVNGSDPTLTLYAAAALLFYTPEKAGAERLRVLSMAPQPQRLSRVAPGVLELETLGARQSHAFEQLFRDVEHPLREGESIDLGELAVHVEATSGGLFTRARFNFDGDLERLRSCLIVWTGGKLESIPVPALGRAVRVEHEPGPMGL